MILCDCTQHTNSYEKLRAEVIPYGEYFLWGKNFHGTTIYCVMENFFFAEANFQVHSLTVIKHSVELQLLCAQSSNMNSCNTT